MAGPDKAKPASPLPPGSSERIAERPTPNIPPPTNPNPGHLDRQTRPKTK